MRNRENHNVVFAYRITGGCFFFITGLIAFNMKNHFKILYCIDHKTIFLFQELSPYSVRPIYIFWQWYNISLTWHPYIRAMDLKNAINLKCRLSSLIHRVLQEYYPNHLGITAIFTQKDNCFQRLKNNWTNWHNYQYKDYVKYFDENFQSLSAIHKSGTYVYNQMLSLLPWDGLPGSYGSWIQLQFVCTASGFDSTDWKLCCIRLSSDDWLGHWISNFCEWRRTLVSFAVCFETLSICNVRHGPINSAELAKQEQTIAVYTSGFILILLW